MKTAAIAAVMIIAYSISVYASEEQFPKIGATYRIAYAQKPEGFFWPIEIRVLKHGVELWYFVEYQNEAPISGRRKDKQEKASKDTSSTTSTQRKWLNFAWLQAVEEK